MVTKRRLPRSAPEARREDIVVKASELFLNDGFAATSMSTVARAVGGSKATLYKYFFNKESLFEAVMEQKSSAILEPIHSISISNEDPVSFLSDVGERLLTGIFQAEALALYRVVVGDCTRSPEIGRVFCEKGPDRGRAIVASRLGYFSKNGLLQIDDPVQAAEDFFALLRGEVHFRVMAGVRPIPDAAEISGHVKRVVGLLMRSWAPNDRG